MKRRTVYLETSVIGYASSLPSRDLVAAARQRITRDWFANHAEAFDLYVSQLVIDEIAAGDKTAAGRRIDVIESVPVLALTGAAARLAGVLVSSGAIPPTAAEDALHIAVAAVHGIDYILTWNCRHIANAVLRPDIERACRKAGFEAPVICTPEELINDNEG
ncbi:MAG: type II toxin-antitoxin system VapC family toxin [Planctomycetes bacterium]|nr:type II toxin-antitoxin system VapC family toxin [Planctomycetota bacterium]